jgi:hypothetical protein
MLQVFSIMHMDCPARRRFTGEGFIGEARLSKPQQRNTVSQTTTQKETHNPACLSSTQLTPSIAAGATPASSSAPPCPHAAPRPARRAAVACASHCQAARRTAPLRLFAALRVGRCDPPEYAPQPHPVVRGLPASGGRFCKSGPAPAASAGLPRLQDINAAGSGRCHACRYLRAKRAGAC